MKHSRFRARMLAAAFTLAASMSANAHPAEPCHARASACPATDDMHNHHRHGRMRMSARHGEPAKPAGPLMTPDERRLHHERLSGLKTREDCVVYLRHHLARMNALGKERGVSMEEPSPAHDPCAGLP
jgi:hypothetical protein